MRNVILAVGPGTPASALWRSGADEDEDVREEIHFSDESSSSSSSSAEEMHESGESQDEGMDADDDNAETDDGDDHPDDQTMDDRDSEHGATHAENMVRAFLHAQMHPNDSDQSSMGEEDEPGVGWTRSRERHPSLRHGGCINTACWLDCSWQLSGSNHSNEFFSSSSTPTFISQDCPTQLITSGDDRLVKVWDVKDAMGMASPLEGGWDTFSPLANVARPDSTTIHKTWKNYYRKRPDSRMAGSVIHLATLVSGHRGNVFHVLPIADKPGRILTCGADGALRLLDLQSETSSVVTSLGDRSHFLFHPPMAFSHVFLTNNTGLLCSEEGLHRFDLRLSPREQDPISVLSGVGGCLSSDYCKSCAVWSPHDPSRVKGDASEASFVEANYVFAGGRSEYVGLLDLRMGGSRIVQSYRPRALKETENVSVSGIDVSKDGRELLVSYESDQIYTFPILHTCSSKAGPTLEEIDAFASKSTEPVHELASYGGHLNRFTFLKNAKYAGPNDDYICTGSDSGCGWIYERKTGAVVSLMGADKCTCNGVIPHPTLPFFITYGIDSTAKLWRATPPVHSQADDSPSGRARCTLEQSYEMSPVCRSWSAVKRLVERDASPGMLPDYVASPAEMATSYRFSPRESRSICGGSSPKFGNALRLLPSILRRNRHECYRASQRLSRRGSGAPAGGRDTPVEQSVEEFSHRVSLSRLMLQADRLGVEWNPNKPWAIEVSLPFSPTVHRADLVPSSPSDWLLYDPGMIGVPYTESNFNMEELGDVLRERFLDERSSFDDVTKVDLPPWLVGYDLPDDEVVSSNQWLSSQTDAFVRKSRQMFFATIVLLKESGNQAMKEGMLNIAAERYDKAIQYCAVALMKHMLSKDRLRHLACKNPTDKKKNGEEDGDSKGDSRPRSSVIWTPLIQLLVTTRLNMSLWLLRPEHADPRGAMDQAKAALQFLRPFTSNKDDTGVQFLPGDANILSLQAKAHFRLGSAKLELGNYGEAVECFEASLQESKTDRSSGEPPDALVVRKLKEAKRKLRRKKKADKKRYQQAFQHLATSQNDNDDEASR